MKIPDFPDRTRVEQLADSCRDLPADERPMIVARMVLQDGTVIEGRSGFEGANHPEVQEALDNVPKERRSDYHGGCAEIDCLNQARWRGLDTDGAVIQTAIVRGKGSQAGDHGMPKTPCLYSCQEVLAAFGVAYR